MLRFLFKKKGEKGFEEQARKFWIYASGEFVLVFLGILVALQVDNWNQERQKRKMETILLEEMLVNLGDDMEDIEWAMRYLKGCIASNQIALNFLYGDQAWHDSLEIHFGRLIQSTTFVNNTSAYESLNSIGIDLIRNDELRQRVTHLYSARYKYTEAKELDGLLANFHFHYPALRQHLEYLPGGKARPVDLDLMRSDIGLRSNLVNYMHLVGLSVNAYEMTREASLALMDMIRKEL